MFDWRVFEQNYTPASTSRVGLMHDAHLCVNVALTDPRCTSRAFISCSKKRYASALEENETASVGRHQRENDAELTPDVKKHGVYAGVVFCVNVASLYEGFTITCLISDPGIAQGDMPM